MLNNSQTTGTISPASPAAGGQFNLTNYQTTVNIPMQVAQIAQALQPNLEGSATAQLDITGATPATMSLGPFDFNQTLPATIPSDGIMLALPAAPETVGPFSATSSAITVQQNSNAPLTLTLNGTALQLNCTAYPNDDVATSGVDSGAGPSGDPIDPVIAVAGGGAQPVSATGGSGSGSTSTTAGSGVVTAPSSSLAFTGAGRGIGWLGVAGASLLLVGVALLFLVDTPRRLLASLRFSKSFSLSEDSSNRPSRLVGRGMDRLRSWLLGE